MSTHFWAEFFEGLFAVINCIITAAIIGGGFAIAAAAIIFI